MSGRVTRFVKVSGFRRGVLGGDRRWLTVWALLAGLGWLRSKATPQEEVAYRTELAVGEKLVISHEPAPPTRRQLRRAARTPPG